MQQTSKYQFNLVDTTDDFSPEPLNQNMEKVEEALKGQAAALEAAKGEFPVVRLGSYTAATATVDASFDLSGVDMGQFAYLELWVGGVTATAGQLNLQFNGDGGNKYVASGSSGLSPVSQFTLLNFSVNSYPTDFVLQIVDEARGRVHFVGTTQSYQNMNYGAGYGTVCGMYTGCGLGALTAIRVYGSQELNAGVRMTLYGVRK